MKQIKFIIFVLPFLLKLALCDQKVVCYFGSWSVYRPGQGHFSIDDIDPHLCTHLIYNFVGITALGEIRVDDEFNDLPKGNDGFNEFTALKFENPALKTLVAIGGASEGSIPFSYVMKNAVTRTAFVHNAVEFLQKYNFDGLDIDWEYPARLGGIPDDKENFVKLLEELREAFNEHGLLLSAAVAAAEFAVDISYNVPMLSKHLDLINVMAYDFHGPWENRTGQNAPLFVGDYPARGDEDELQDKEGKDDKDGKDLPDPQDELLARQLCVSEAVRHWIAAGAAPEKLVLGIAFYGRTYTLADPKDTRLGAPSLGRGLPGPYTGEPGMLGYNEICEKQMTGDFVFVWDQDQQVPHTYYTNQWIGYDNLMSVRIKAQKAVEWKLGGVAVWSIDTDDFRGICHKGKKFPLLRAISKIILSSSATDSKRRRRKI